MRKLTPWQIDGIQYLRERGGIGALFWEMRLRKTLTVIRYLKMNALVRRVLVLGPYSVLQGWSDDLTKDGIPEEQIHVVYGTGAERCAYLEAYKNDAGWFMLNKEQHLTVGASRWWWDAIVLDESTFIAAPTSSVTKDALKNLKAPKRILLTGTPAPEDEMQYVCQLNWMDENILGMNYYHFRAKYCRPELGGWVLRPKGIQVLAAAVAKHCSSLTRADVGKIVEREYRVRVLEMPKAVYKQYRKLEKEWLLGDELIKWSGVRWNEMRAMCGGIDTIETCTHRRKLDELLYLLSTELKDQRIIIWAWYRAELDAIVAELGPIGTVATIHGDVPASQRAEVVQRFKNGDVDWLVMQPETVKFGTNLVGADAVVFFSSPAGLQTRTQAEARSEDIDGTAVTLIIDLVIKDTVEEDVYAGLQKKENSVKCFERIRKRARARLEG